ncbi:MAG: NAD(P)H-dependent oxidoreductase [Burkholderiaceae bacterium]|nr:MAG: NAD(P)H-dependent oxidoreductase [Burkholderiaceae bacterium]
MSMTLKEWHRALPSSATHLLLMPEPIHYDTQSHLSSLQQRRILSLCGSLRQKSINRSLLTALAMYCDESSDRESQLAFQQFERMGELPLFNPDLETQLPAAVQALHAAIAWSDALVIASPEYAHGVTAVIKNALDWCVSLEAFVNKPVLILQARARSQFADAALHETLRTMSAQIINHASVVFELDPSCFHTEGMLASSKVRQSLQNAKELLLGASLTAV